MKKLGFWRKKYPRFVYQKYAYQVAKNDLKIVFDFLIEPGINFKPEIIIKNINKARLAEIGEDVMNNFVFHLGLMEIPSYWKATCSPEIIIEAGSLSQEQISWWKDLIIKGMGQFFYKNRIDSRQNFLKISGGQGRPKETFDRGLKDRYLIPVGGGKDSIVTLEKLKAQKKNVNVFAVNPTQAIKEVLKVAGIIKPIVVERKIDPVLLNLNNKGYLNGHTPFTAVLSFLSAFCAVLFNYRQIAFSNERSADEGNVKYLGKTVNHQWAKSSEFENMFKDYCRKYLVKDLNYFSFLRKYTELEIAQMFTKYPKHFIAFSSCNRGLKTGKKWCQNCPKCLFTYLILYPFLTQKDLLKIFSKDLFANKKLLATMKELLGQGRHKPFECVGTYRESRLAFQLGLKKAKKSGKIPYLLAKLNVGKF